MGLDLFNPQTPSFNSDSWNIGWKLVKVGFGLVYIVKERVFYV